MRASALISLVSTFVLFAASLTTAAEPHKDPAALLRDLPTVFEPNVGQVPQGYDFVVRRPELSAAFALDFADLSLRSSSVRSSHLQLRFIDGKSAAIRGEKQLSSKTNYLIGNVPEQWHTGVSNYGRIRYPHLYPGVDLLFYGNGRKLEHDFVVAPGGNPSHIRLKVKGQTRISLQENGDLVMKLQEGHLTFRKPRAYQIGTHGSEEIAARFVLRDSTISFRIARYDHRRTLIIDPVIIFSTYLAGGTAEFLNGAAVDGTGNVYVTGSTSSTDFPTTPTSFQPTCPTCVPASRQGDAFVSKLDPTGKSLVYSTFLGGSAQDSGSSIRVDANGNALIAGITSSLNFPSLNPINANPPCCNLDLLFVTSLSPDGSALNYSGLVGAISFNTFVSLAADSQGSAYIATQTDFVDFPITPGTFSGIPATNPAGTLVVLKVSSTGTLVYSTAVPGTAPPAFGTLTDNCVPTGIAVDASGNVFVAGTAGAGMPTTTGALAGALPADASLLRTGYALKLDAAAANLLYATYIPETDDANALAIDTSGGAYVGGDTSSTKLPVPINAAVPAPTCGGTSCTFGYIVKLDITGGHEVAATYMNGTSTGNQFNSVKSLDLDATGNVLVAGTTSDPSFPTKNPLQSILQHSTSFGETGFISEMKGDLSSFLFSTFLSGTTGAFPSQVAAGASGQLIVAGITSDTDFPTTPGAFQTVLPVPNIGVIPQHGFIASIDVATAAASVCFDKTLLDFGGVLVNTTASQALTVSNCGNADLHITSTLPSSPLFAATGCTTAVTPGNSCTITVTYSPIDTSTVSAALSINDDAGFSPQIIPLSGLGGLPDIVLPNGLFFGDLQVGTSTAGIATIFNSGQGALNLSTIAISGDFSIVKNGCAAQLLPAAGCALTIKFSPTVAGARTGSLTITDNAQGSPHVVPLSGNGLTQLPLPLITDTPAIAASTGGLTVFGRNFFPGSVVQWNGSARPTTFVSEFSLSVQLTPADLAQIGEGTVTVLNPAPGGGLSNTVIVPVFATLPINAQDMVFDPLRNVIYASVGAAATTNANTILVIDPATQTIVNSFPVGNNPDKLAISDDAQFLYVGLDAASSVAQLSLPSGTVNGSATLNSSLIGLTAGAIRVLPGLPHSYVVSVIEPNVSPGFDHAVVFDDFTARPNQVSRISGPTVEADTLTFLGTNNTTLYAGTIDLFPDSFYRLSLDANGLALIDETQNIAGGLLQSDGSSIFVSNGKVIDPATKTNSAGFILTAPSLAFTVDAPASRTFFAELGLPAVPLPRPTAQIEAFDNKSKNFIGQIHFQGPTLPFSLSQMLRWGQDGLALQMNQARQSQSSVVLLRTSLTSRPAVPGFQISGAGINGYIPPATIAAGETATFNLHLTADPTFTGQVALSCSGLPAASSCNASPATLTVAAGGTSATSITISTTKQVASTAPATAPWNGTFNMLAMLLMPIGLVSLRRNRRRSVFLRRTALIILAGVLIGCGGGSSTPPPPAPPNFTATGTYNVVLTGTSGTVSRQVSLTVIVQ